MIDQLDQQLNLQLNEILHHPDFQGLEARWRGLQLLCEQNQQRSDSTCKIKLLSLSWRELCRDINQANDFDQSHFYRLVYSQELNTAGGEPFGLLIGDYYINSCSSSTGLQKQGLKGQMSHDLAVLRAISHTAAAAFCPFVTSTKPSLFGVDQFRELATVHEIGSQFEQADYRLWRQLRQQQDSRFLAIVLPQILMRSPYKQGDAAIGFPFQETIKQAADYLWGNAAYALASVVMRGFKETGWFNQIRGVQAGSTRQGLITQIPAAQCQLSRRSHSYRAAVNLQIGDQLASQLADQGFVPLMPVPMTPYLAMYSNATLYSPEAHTSSAATMNERLSSMLQYVLCVSRFAHFLKTIGREKVGSFESAAMIERELQTWLHQYTTASDEATDEIRARYPLQQASIQVKDRQDKPGHYYSIIHLRPHFQLDHMVSSIRLITELSPT